jgi:hypothetical protein
VNALLIAVLGGMIGALAPVLLIRANGRERRKDQLLTWERDDKVAEQLLAAQQESIARTDQVAEHVAASTSATTAKLDIIKTLVDGTLTKAMQDALDASRRELVALLELADIQLNSGTPPTADRIATITALRRRVGELSAQMQDREAQIRAADIQIATEAARIAQRDGDG